MRAGIRCRQDISGLLGPKRLQTHTDFRVLVGKDRRGQQPGVFRPGSADSEATERSITAPETEIGYYQGDSLALEDVLREQVLLSLPVKTLCEPECKGLCPRCGANRNNQPCSCEVGPSDPRWTALAGLRSQMKS